MIANVIEEQFDKVRQLGRWARPAGDREHGRRSAWATLLFVAAMRAAGAEDPLDCARHAGRAGLLLLCRCLYLRPFLYVPGAVPAAVLVQTSSVFIAFPLSGFHDQMVRPRCWATGAMLHALGHSLEVGAIAAALSDGAGACLAAKALTRLPALPGRPRGCLAFTLAAAVSFRTSCWASSIPDSWLNLVGIPLFAADGDRGALPDLRAVRHTRVLMSRFGRLRQESGGSIARTLGRDRLDDVSLARDLSARPCPASSRAFCSPSSCRSTNS